MIDRMDPSLPTVRIAMWRADAIVLFDWLMSVDLNAVPVSHPAEKQALADLLTRLEHETDIPGVTQEQIDSAREEVARAMGW
jgi:hypothetical protein